MDPREEARLFHEGLHLFNTGRWFEAHEAWEDIWHEAEGDRKPFYQGLIQAAVTLEHVRRGNPRGVRNVFASCRSKFERVPRHMMGVDTHALLEALEAFIRPVLEMPAEAFTPRTGRGQDLPVDLDEAPSLELEEDPFGES